MTVLSDKTLAYFINTIERLEKENQSLLSRVIPICDNQKKLDIFLQKLDIFLRKIYPLCQTQLKNLNEFNMAVDELVADVDKGTPEYLYWMRLRRGL